MSRLRRGTILPRDLSDIRMGKQGESYHLLSRRDLKIAAASFCWQDGKCVSGPPQDALHLVCLVLQEAIAVYTEAARHQGNLAIVSLPGRC